METKGGITIKDIKIGDKHTQLLGGETIHSEVVSLPTEVEESCWMWESKNLDTGEIIEYSVTKGFEHLGVFLGSYGTIFSRLDYIIKKKCTHRQYYAQFVCGLTMNSIASIGDEKLMLWYENGCKPGIIPLEVWDKVNPIIKISFFTVGDTPTLSGIVCVAQEAAQQWCETQVQNRN